MYQYSEGPEKCSICFITSHPIRRSGRVGKAFSEKTDKQFSQMLVQAGISRSECRIVPVIREIPIKKDVSAYITISSTGKKIKTTPLFDQYERELYEELGSLNTNLLVPLGDVPLYSLLRQKGIAKWRGSVLPSVVGIKAIPTLAPEDFQFAGGRTYTQYRTASIFDFRRIERDRKFPELDHPIRYLQTAPSYIEAMDYLEKCRENKVIAFDIEIYNMEVSCISFAISPYDVMSIPFIQLNGTEYFTPDKEGEIWRKIASILEDPSITKIGQNLIFDNTFLFTKYGIVVKNIEDTMIAQGIITPDLPKGLDFLTSIYTREPYYKGEGKERMKSDRTPDEVFWQYNCRDSAVCMEIFPIQKEKLIIQNNLKTYELHRDLIGPLSFIQGRGILVDSKMLIDASLDASDKIITLTEELNTLCKCTINPNSTKQIMGYFYISKGVPPYISRKTGLPTADETALMRLSRKGHKEADILLQIRKLSKMKSTYLDVKLDEDNRVRSSFNPVGTTSGRLSSRKTIFGTGMNTQNLTPELKRALIVDKGYVFYEIDLAQAENRVVAYIAPEYNMISAFESGIDIHIQTAALILSKPTSEISKEERNKIGKPSNHGLNYGESYSAFALINGIMEKEAKIIVERYHDVYPGIRMWHRNVINSLSKNKTLSTPFGRSRLFLGRWGDELFKEAYSFIPQSVVAQVINERGLLYIYNNQDLFAPIELLNNVHDSIVFQIPVNIGWNRHIYMLDKIVSNLQAPIPHATGSFSIPTNIEMGLNMDNTIEIKLNENSLKETYEILRSE